MYTYVYRSDMHNLVQTLNLFEHKFSMHDKHETISSVADSSNVNSKDPLKVVLPSDDIDQRGMYEKETPVTPEKELQEIFSSFDDDEEENNPNSNVPTSSSRKKISPRRIQLLANMRIRKEKIRANNLHRQQQCQHGNQDEAEGRSGCDLNATQGEFQRHNKHGEKRRILHKRLQPSNGTCGDMYSDEGTDENMRLSPEGMYECMFLYA